MGLRTAGQYTADLRDGCEVYNRGEQVATVELTGFLPAGRSREILAEIVPKGTRPMRSEVPSGTGVGGAGTESSRPAG